MINDFYWAVGENAVGAAILALAVFCITRFWKNPTVRHSLWLLVLLKLVVPPLISLPLIRTSAGPSADLVQVMASPASDRQTVDNRVGGPPPTAQPAAITPPVVGSSAAPNRSVAENVIGQLSPSILLAVVWAAGSIVWLVIAGVRIVRFHRAVNLAHAADARLGELAAEVALRLGYGRPVEVRISTGKFPPLLWAVGHARIVLPEFAVTDLTPTQLTGILAHEIAHLVRRDHWVRWLEFAIFACYWWNPIVWWARRELRAAEEQACDARVVDGYAGIDQSYVEALMAMIDRADASSDRIPTVASALGGEGTLKRRVEAILVHRDWRLGKLGVAAIAVSAISLLCTVRSAADQPPAAAPAAPPVELPKKTVPAADAGGQRIVATTAESKAVTLTQQYVCQIHAHRHIQVRALEKGYLEAMKVKEGQAVKAGDPMFKVIPVLYQKKAEAEMAEATHAQLEYNYTKKYYEDKVVSKNEVALLEAKLLKARANAELAQAELDFATVKAPFDGIIGRLQHQQGSLVLEGDVLTTLSDNSVMWVYFNVPDAVYLEYMADPNQQKEDLPIELVLANGKTFPHVGKFGAIDADFNSQTGNIPFRADFPNPDRLLRHGQTGTVIIRRALKDDITIPQRAAFEVLGKKYVYVIDKDDVARQREIVIQNQTEDDYVIKQGLAVGDKIIVEGVRRVRDGEKVKYEVN